jgi:hypothetical protein
MYKSIGVGLAITLIGYAPAYASYCNCNAKYPAKYHVPKYTKHYYPSHETVRVPSYPVPCSVDDRNYYADHFLYCVVISPLPGESQSRYDARTIIATRYYVSLERSQRREDMRKECRQALQLEPTLPSAEPDVRDHYTGIIASCRSAGF